MTHGDPSVRAAHHKNAGEKISIWNKSNIPWRSRAAGRSVAHHTGWQRRLGLLRPRRDPTLPPAPDPPTAARAAGFQRPEQSPCPRCGHVPRSGGGRPGAGRNSWTCSTDVETLAVGRHPVATECLEFGGFGPELGLPTDPTTQFHPNNKLKHPTCFCDRNTKRSTARCSGVGAKYR